MRDFFAKGHAVPVKDFFLAVEMLPGLKNISGLPKRPLHNLPVQPLYVRSDRFNEQGLSKTPLTKEKHVGRQAQPPDGCYKAPMINQQKVEITANLLIGRIAVHSREGIIYRRRRR